MFVPKMSEGIALSLNLLPYHLL